jgi:hypothetical protein
VTEGHPPSAPDGMPVTSTDEVPTVSRRRPAATRSRRVRRGLRWVVITLLGLVAVFIAAWGIDSYLHRDRVARNTDLAGKPVGGMSRAELQAVVGELGEQFPVTPINIRADDLSLEDSAAALGISIDQTATTDAVWAVGRDGSWVIRPFRWATSLVGPAAADVRLAADTAVLEPAVTELEGDRRIAPVEPGIDADAEAVRLVPGTDGRELTSQSVLDALPRTLSTIGSPIAVTVTRTVVPPTVSDAAVQTLVDRANEVTTGELSLGTGSGSPTKVPAADFRPAFVLAGMDATPPDPRLSMAADEVDEILADKLPAPPANPTGVRFDIRGGTPVPVAGRDAQVCCGADAGEAIVTALLEGRDEVQLPTRTVTASQGVEWAQGLGVKQVVGQFTTNHPAGQPRVQNIHRIADVTRGVLIAPGETFSVNGFVGRRTTEKGYVSAPVIENGEFTEGVGGGVSQYATTLFNAAFFAGLDIPAYKAHSKYISRYPFGREATLAYPGVDLKIRNQSPHGVVIWPSYTASSITVQLWSSPYARGEQTGQNKTSGCGRVTIERTRTFNDGRGSKDTFNANYDCE